jgi:hypothetical protein
MGWSVYALPQMPLCYSPSIEYNLEGLVGQGPSANPNASTTVLFPGIAKPRREEILSSLRASGIHTRVGAGNHVAERAWGWEVLVCEATYTV